MSAKNYASRRRGAFTQAAKKSGPIDAFLVSGVQDVSYLSGFTGEDSMLLVGGNWACLLTDGRFGEQAQWECPGCEIRVRSGESMSVAAATVLKTRRARRLGIQPEHLTVVQHNALQKALTEIAGKSSRTLPAADVGLHLRSRKDGGEVRAIRKAIAVAEKAFLELTGRGAKWFVGRTERQVAAELEHLMKDAGASDPSFESIIGVGAHSSLCHYRPGDTKIRRGQALLMDWGALVDGYCSDLTRVVFIDTIPPQLGQVYETVRLAQQAAIAAIRPGVSGKAVDFAARSVIEKAGYGDKFVHSIGHGLGRQVHEMPWMGKLSKARLKAGMVVTVEPGIYLPGVGGVRIEDDILVTPRGHQRLSTLPRNLESMVLS